jgi:hypothetical protein
MCNGRKSEIDHTLHCPIARFLVHPISVSGVSKIVIISWAMEVAIDSQLQDSY